MTREGRRDRGFALLIVLWTLVLLSFLASVIVTSAGQQLRTVAALRRATQIQAMADGAVWEGAFHALDRSAGHWAADGRDHVRRGGGMAVRIRLTSEAGLVNPNSASRPLLAALLQACGAQKQQAGTIAANIADWRGSAAQGVTPRTRALYLAAGLPYTPPGNPFRSVAEVGLVLGMTPALWLAVQPHLSVTQPNDPDIAMADPVVRQALRQAGSVVPNAPEGSRSVTVIVDVAVDDGEGTHASRHAVVLLAPDVQGGVDDMTRILMIHA
ncbi:general secretion pathway protein GspK [Gluconacetobacter diazotrophicus]|uniref:General secretion pathway protein GspK n=1 Tax=Gluconacetobacter diazotrophicus TaxID=33996 RepID=A0A7W4FC35_GLUDI|nr:type II secretion system protein GspK [Gluconacetobacter diazotrophicus]MBB2155001.1 general secretion pathway protein GspK [Gluconacetobacter diazotrophicus]